MSAAGAKPPKARSSIIRLCSLSVAGEKNTSLRRINHNVGACPDDLHLLNLWLTRAFQCLDRLLEQSGHTRSPKFKPVFSSRIDELHLSGGRRKPPQTPEGPNILLSRTNAVADGVAFRVRTHTFRVDQATHWESCCHSDRLGHCPQHRFVMTTIRLCRQRFSRRNCSIPCQRSGAIEQRRMQQHS